MSMDCHNKKRLPAGALYRMLIETKNSVSCKHLSLIKPMAAKPSIDQLDYITYSVQYAQHS